MKFEDLDIEQGFVLGQADALKYLKWIGEQYLDEAMHDYQDTDIIAEQMDIPSNLLEHVAGRIIAAVRAEYPEVGHIRLKISKLDPPVAGLDSATLSVED